MMKRTMICLFHFIYLQLNKSNYQNCQRDSSITGTTKNHTSGMYLGNECYPEFYDLHSLKEAQELFYGYVGILRTDAQS